jgi:hypothetical protein
VGINSNLPYELQIYDEVPTLSLFSDYAQNTIKDGGIQYKWTIKCVLVVRSTNKGTQINVITISVVRIVVKYGLDPQPPRLLTTSPGWMIREFCKIEFRIPSSGTFFSQPATDPYTIIIICIGIGCWLTGKRFGIRDSIK